MTSNNPPLISLRPWADEDYSLLERLMGDPAMTDYLGGPESPEKIRKRHQKYIEAKETDHTRVFVILTSPENTPAGSVVYWEREQQGEKVWEIGWSVLPEFQGQGIASNATRAAIDLACAEKKHRFMVAFPSIDNAASNALCRKLGFELEKVEDFEYPKEHWMSCTDLLLDLFSQS